MRKLKLFFACLLMAVLSIGQMWGENFSTTYSYGGTDWIRSGAYSDESTYYKTDADNDFVATVSGIFTGKTITSDVVITLDVACYGNGESPTSGKFSIYTSSACSQQVAASQGGTLPTDKYYKNTTYTVTSANAANFSNDLAIKVAGGTKLIRFRSFKVEFTYTTGAPSYTITAVSNNDLWGTVSGTTTISAVPEDGYRVKAGDEGYTVTAGEATVTNNGDNTFSVSTSENCTVQINFEAIPSYTVTWDNHGLTSTTQVLDGEKPEFPSTPSSCDPASTTFIGWATDAWEGKATNLEDSKLSGITIYTSASAMPVVKGAVKYYAVYAEVSGTTGWVLTDIADLTSTDVFVMADESNYALNNDGGTSAAPSTNAITVSAGKITSTVADNLKWNISGNATDGYTFYPNESTTTWLYCNTTAASSSNNNMRVGTGDRKVFEVNASGYLKTKDTYTARYLSRYDDSNGPKDFRGYTGTNTNPVKPKCYKYSAGTTSNYMTTCAAAGTCEAPSFSPAEGTFDAAQNVELLTSTPSATIYYTLDGSDPDDGSDEYTAAIHITKNTKIKAITYAAGLTKSPISEGEFKIRYAQPTFTPSTAPVDGKYTSAITVTLAAEGADAIYYAIGATPTIDEEHKYTAPIALNTAGSKTINAIAVKTGYENSNVASGTFVMDLPYANIKAFIDGESAKAAANRELMSVTLSNAIITGRAANYNNQNVLTSYTLYVQDETAGIMIYALPTSLDAKAAANHSISGTIKAMYSIYNNQHEMVKKDNNNPIDLSNVIFSDDEIDRPAITSYTSLADAYTAKPMMLVKLTDVKYESVDQYFNATFSEQKIYNTFKNFNSSTVWPETTDNCDITGVVIKFNTTYELLPVFTSDVVAKANAANPTVSPAGGADAENAVTTAAVEITAAAKTKVDGLASKTVDINSTIPAEVTVTVTRDFYTTVNYSCGWYKAATVKYAINGQTTTAEEGTIVAKVENVAAETAAEGDEVHVFITPNTHFHFANISVNSGAVATTEVVANEEYKFTMPAAEATIVVTYTQDQQATLTFAKGEATGTEDAPTAITDYVGETVQLPANPFTYNGYKFIGWSCDGGTTKLAAGADYELAENKAFVAYWAAIPTFNDADHEWRLATSLEAGKYYVIGSASQDKTASKTITSGYMSEIDSEIEDGVIAYDALGANTAIFLLGGNSTDGWTLTEVTTDDVLGTTANKNVSWNAGTQVWAISIAEGGNATIGGTSRILHNAANTGKRFTTYTSDLTASMLLPQLYVWTEKAFKLRYDANGGTNAPTATPAAAGKATVTDEQPTAPTGKIFDGWNENELGTGENYAAGDEISITSADVTIFAKWRDPYTYTVSYDANEGEGSMEADADQEEGSLYTIKPNEFTREGYGFAGWKAYDALDNELTITNGKFYIPTSNVTVKAQWNEIVTTNFVLVGNVNQLNAGDEVYIVAAASNNAMGTQDNVYYRSRVEIGKTAGQGRVIITATAPVKFTLGKDGDNFTFFDGEGYLCATSSSNNNMGTQTDLDDNGKWSISINANGEATIIAQGTYTRNHMQYNANSGQERFSCYKSDNTMPKVSIYKKASAEVIRGELSNGKWGTICPKQNVENATGATFYQISYLEEQNGLPFNMVFDPITGTTLTAGQPYFFIATGEEITGVKVGVELSEADDAGVNGFYGYIGNDVKALSWKTDYVAGEDNTFVIYGNTVMRLNAATNLKSERCYININATEPTRIDPTPGAAPRRRVVVGVSGANAATGIDELNASETPVKMIIDGQLFIIRGEKMYNVNGQVVK